MRVALFITCFNDTLFPSAGRAVVEVLERVGCTVEFPLEQTCCGQMHVNSGYEHEAGGLMSRFARVFSGFDAVVSPSASCVAHVRERIADGATRVRIDRVPDRSSWAWSMSAPRSRTASRCTRPVTRCGCWGSATGRGGCCEAVRGIDLVELEGERECCGFGGTFAIKNADTSMAMLSDKVRHVLDTRAEVCTSADTSCLMHIGGALSRGRTGVRTMHLAEILAAQE